MPELAPSDPNEFAHVIHFGKYEIPVDPATGERRVLGRGGMGVTYKARDANLGRITVLKVIVPGALQGDADQQKAARARFLREAKALAVLKHPAIPFLYEYGKEAGEDFYAMEFIDGEDLDRRVKLVGALSIEEALHVAEQVARALGAAHRAGIVHRDVKPANLMLSRCEEGGRGTVKLIDFGLAKDFGGTADFGWSSAGSSGYTPYFASPEQCREEPASTRSDLYSLGVTLWHLLTGKPPFVGTSAWEVGNKHNQAPLPLECLPANLPPAAKDLLMRMMAKAPEGRPGTADEIAGEIGVIRRMLDSEPQLDRSLANAPTMHHPATVAFGNAPTLREAPASGRVSTSSSAPTSSRGKVWVASAGLAAAGIVVLAGMNFGWSRSSGPPRTTVTPTAEPTLTPAQASTRTVPKAVLPAPSSQVSRDTESRAPTNSNSQLAAPLTGVWTGLESGDWLSLLEPRNNQGDYNIQGTNKRDGTRGSRTAKFHVTGDLVEGKATNGESITYEGRLTPDRRTIVGKVRGPNGVGTWNLSLVQQQ